MSDPDKEGPRDNVRKLDAHKFAGSSPSTSESSEVSPRKRKYDEMGTTGSQTASRASSTSSESIWPNIEKNAQKTFESIRNFKSRKRTPGMHTQQHTAPLPQSKPSPEPMQPNVYAPTAPIYAPTVPEATYIPKRVPPLINKPLASSSSSSSSSATSHAFNTVSSAAPFEARRKPTTHLDASWGGLDQMIAQSRFQNSLNTTPKPNPVPKLNSNLSAADLAFRFKQRMDEDKKEFEEKMAANRTKTPALSTFTTNNNNAEGKTVPLTSNGLEPVTTPKQQSSQIPQMPIAQLGAPLQMDVPSHAGGFRIRSGLTRGETTPIPRPRASPTLTNPPRTAPMTPPFNNTDTYNGMWDSQQWADLGYILREGQNSFRREKKLSHALKRMLARMPEELRNMPFSELALRLFALEENNIS